MGGCGGGVWRQPSFEDAEIQLSVWRRRQIPKERPLQRLCSTQDHVHMLFVIMPKQIIRFRKSMVWPTPFAVFPWALLYVPACSGANGSCTGLQMALVTGPLQCPWRQKAVFSSVRRIKFQANRTVKNTPIPSHYTGWLTGIPFITKKPGRSILTNQP